MRWGGRSHECRSIAWVSSAQFQAEWLVDDSPKLVRLVILPLLISCALACGLAAYQLAVDITFLNSGWAVFGRSGNVVMPHSYRSIDQLVSS